MFQVSLCFLKVGQAYRHFPSQDSLPLLMLIGPLRQENRQMAANLCFCHKEFVRYPQAVSYFQYLRCGIYKPKERILALALQKDRISLAPGLILCLANNKPWPRVYKTAVHKSVPCLAIGLFVDLRPNFNSNRLVVYFNPH